MWPYGKRPLQLRMVGIACCVLLSRALNVLVPRQLGILVNTLGIGNTTSAYSALAFYILFNWIQSNMSVFHDVLWGPVEIYARGSLECASYNHVMSLSCDFHDTKQSGEMFEAINQGSSVVVSVLLYIA